MHYFFFCKQKTAYEMRSSDWSSDVCSSDLSDVLRAQRVFGQVIGKTKGVVELERDLARQGVAFAHANGSFVEQTQTILQRLAEFGFLALQRLGDQRLRADQFGIGEIGRASCRERVCQYV